MDEISRRNTNIAQIIDVRSSLFSGVWQWGSISSKSSSLSNLTFEKFGSVSGLPDESQRRKVSTARSSGGSHATRFEISPAAESACFTT